MITRIEVFAKSEDARAKVKKEKLESLGFKKDIKNVFLADVYTLDKNLSNQQIKQIACALTNPVSQTASINSSLLLPEFDWTIETGFLPGVTDNIANTAKEIIEDLLKLKFVKNEGVYSSNLIFIKGDLSRKEVGKIGETLINPLIQRVYVKSVTEYKKDKGMDKIVPLVRLDKEVNVDLVNLNVDDDELIKIGKSGIANKDGTRRGPLALDLTYMKTVQAYFKRLGRNPADIEIESIAQTWSEHCKHTIFADPIDDIKNGLFKTFIKGATEEIRKRKAKKRSSSGGDICVSVFTDNSGAIEFDDHFLITYKAETHNSPSALDPFGGAITGIVGVNRDTIGFGLGAKPIINTYGFCFADPKTKTDLYRDAKLTQKTLSPQRIMEGVIEGVNSGGNCSGIPTPQGFVYFDSRYHGKPLVFVGTLGLIPKKTGKRLNFKKKARPNDYIVMVGGRVGQDGIHGATFSSEALDSGSPATAVQIGDPITQKKLSDALVKEARDLNLYHSITDNGAGGLSCSVAEMAKEAGGCVVNLEKVPLKYPGLEPWKIWVSESQERMTLAVPKNKWKKFFKLMQKRGVEATIIGHFNASKRCLVKYHSKKIMDVEMDFLHYGLPPRPMKSKAKRLEIKKTPLPRSTTLTEDLLAMLQRPNLASFEFISTQYDHEVQGSSVIKPLQGRGRINGETTVTKPLLNSNKGVAISQGLYPNYSNLDSYRMAAASIDTAIRNIVAAGGDVDKIALLDNFCWCSSSEPERLYQLKQAALACRDYALIYETPFISGKDSMFNDFKGFNERGNPVKISVPPTLLISSLSVLDNVLKTISIDVKFPEDLIYVLGETAEEMGGSEYFVSKNLVSYAVPQVEALKNRRLYQDFYQCAVNNLISSAISVTRGGLGIALAKMSMAGLLGMDVSLKKIKGSVSRDDFALFSESQGRIAATVSPKNKKAFEKMMGNSSFSCIGKVTQKPQVVIKGDTAVKINLEQALKAYKSAFHAY